MAETIQESRSVILTEAVDPQTGLFEIMLLTPGDGSSGYYSPEVVEAAGTSGAFPRGTQLFLDHPTVSEEMDRPERSVRDLAGVLTESAKWNGEGLTAKAKVYSTYRTLLGEAAEDIGMSIRATADVSEGKRPDGTHGRIVERIGEGISVDFVTRAGRGGRVMSVIESARERESHDEQVAETVQMIKDLGYRTFVSAQEAADALNAIDWTLTDDPSARTEYVPVAPAGDTTEESGRTPMAEIADGELATLRESAGQVTTLVSERDAAVARADAAEARVLSYEARDHVRKHVAEQNGTLDADVIDRIAEAACRTIPTKADGTLDTDALDTAAESARKVEETYLARHGARVGGTATGVLAGEPGTDGDGKAPSMAEFRTLMAEAFDRPYAEQIREG